MPFDGPFGFDVQKTSDWAFRPPDTFGVAFTPKAMDNWGTTTGTFRCAFLANDATVDATDSLPGSVGGTLAAGMMVSGSRWGSGGLRLG